MKSNSLLNNAEEDYNRFYKFDMDINDYKTIINLNPQIEDEIGIVKNRTITNLAKFILCEFNLEYFNLVENLANNIDKNSDEYVDVLILINSLTDHINYRFSEFNTYLNITSKEDLDNIKYIFEISKILLEEAFEENDIEVAYEVLYQLSERIKIQGLDKRNFKNVQSKFNTNDIFDVTYTVVGDNNYLGGK